MRQNMKQWIRTTCAALALSTASAGASQAYDWSVTAQVAVVEGSYLPNLVYFTINQAAGNCAAGSWLSWIPSATDIPSKAASAGGVLSILMTAQATSQNITIFGFNNGCSLQFIHLGNY